MKKLLFLTVLFLIGIAAKAQNVVYDNTDATGVRTVIMDGLNLGAVNGVNVYVSLAGFQYNKTVRYSLAVSYGADHQIEIPVDSGCILTLGNGKAVKLPTAAGGAAILKTVDVKLEDVYSQYRRFAYYRFEKNGVLKKAIKKGVKAVDFQLNPSNYSATFDGGEFTALLQSEYEALQHIFGKK